MRARRRACRFSFFFCCCCSFWWMTALVMAHLYLALLSPSSSSFALSTSSFWFSLFFGGVGLGVCVCFFSSCAPGSRHFGSPLVHTFRWKQKKTRKHYERTTEKNKKTQSHDIKWMFSSAEPSIRHGPRVLYRFFFVFHYFFLPSWTPPQRSARSDWIFIQLLASFNLKTQKKKKKDEAVDFTSMLQPCNLTMGRTLLEIWCSTSLDLYCASE